MKRVSQSRAKLRPKILKYWNTNKTLFDIAKLVGCKQPTVKNIFIEKYGEEKLKKRKRKLYRKSKLGNKNPIKGKNGKLHPNFKGRCSDNKGYYTVLKPTWWTGNNTVRIFEHHLVAAIKYGLTEIPKKWVVHHIDFDTANNIPNNLLLMTASSHTKLHMVLKRCNDQDINP